jgi:hypothetical protein
MESMKFMETVEWYILLDLNLLIYICKASFEYLLSEFSRSIIVLVSSEFQQFRDHRRDVWNQIVTQRSQSSRLFSRISSQSRISRIFYCSINLLKIKATIIFVELHL